MEGEKFSPVGAVPYIYGPRAVPQAWGGWNPPQWSYGGSSDRPHPHIPPYHRPAARYRPERGQ